MKKNFFVLAVAGMWWIAARPGDIVTDLGLTTEQFRENVFTNFTNDQVMVHYSQQVRQLAKKIPDGSRVAAVQAMGAVVRSYVSSNDFKTRYQDWLKNKYKISDEQTQQATQAQGTEMSDVKAAYNQQAEMIQNTYSQMPPTALVMMIQSQIEVLQQEISQAEGTDKITKTRELTELKRLQALAKTKPEEFKKQYIANVTQLFNKQMKNDMGQLENNLEKSKQDAESYQKRLAEYRTAPTLNTVVKQRLNDFIALTGTIDFDAQLTKSSYKMEFTNPEYRNQSSHWKLLFRMGKEPVMAARSFAQNWLKELETKR